MAEKFPGKVYVKKKFNFLEEINIFSKIADKLPKNKRLLFLILITLAIPLTVGLALVQQELRSRATGPTIPQTTTKSIKIMTYNIAGFNKGDVYRDPMPMIDALTTYIVDNQIDIVGLQELTIGDTVHKHNKVPVNMHAAIRQALINKGWNGRGQVYDYYTKRFNLRDQFRTQEPNRTEGEGGNSIFSRYPISNKVSYGLINPQIPEDRDHPSGVQTQKVDINIDGAIFQAYNNHMFTDRYDRNSDNPDQRRDCPSRSTTDLINTVLNNDSDSQNKKMRILLGDFNSKSNLNLDDPNKRWCVENIERAGYSRACVPDVSGLACFDTIKSPNENANIDHIFLRKGTFAPFTEPWVVNEAHVDHNSTFSDHFPVIATLSFTINSPPPSPTVPGRGTPTPSITQKPSRIYPTDDVSINSFYPDSNYGDKKILWVDGDPVKKVLLRFNLKTLYGKKTKTINLRMKVADKKHAGSTATLGIKVADNNSWNENRINWNNKPDVGPRIAVLSAPERDTIVNIDLTSYLKLRTDIVTLQLGMENANGAAFYSKETPNSSDRPQLVIEYQ